MRKMVVSILIVLTVFCFLSPAGLAANYSASGDIQPLWTYINTVHNSLSIDTSGVASMHSDITANQQVNKITMNSYIQRYQSGSWSTVSNWSQTTYSSSATWSKTYSVSSGFYYRLLTYFYVYTDSTLLESTSLTTSSVYY